MHIMHIILHFGPYLFAYYFAYFTYFHSCYYFAYNAYFFAYYFACFTFCYKITQFSFNWFTVLATIVWFPIPGPSCWRTTTYNHHCCSLFYHRQPRENPLTLFACWTVLSLSCPLEPEGVVPVCWILGWRITLVQFLCAHTQWWTDIYPPMLCRNSAEINQIIGYPFWSLISLGPQTGIVNLCKQL